MSAPPRGWHGANRALAMGLAAYVLPAGLILAPAWWLSAAHPWAHRVFAALFVLHGVGVGLVVGRFVRLPGTTTPEADRLAAAFRAVAVLGVPFTAVLAALVSWQLRQQVPSPGFLALVLALAGGSTWIGAQRVGAIVRREPATGQGWPAMALVSATMVWSLNAALVGVLVLLVLRDA